ncbi:hypothetical protein OEZ60_21355 [Defluviimonas sp. WL0024]|uniref:Transposase n=1 Tax=Albidovulum salinarum TaxID=2984153 RepID=A0ABT2X9B0_9RHOB|nr:hypothetical protein [Defluviimonas sp. WL0024]
MPGSRDVHAPPLSLRKVGGLRHDRGIEVSHDAVRFWWILFGPMIAAEIRKRRIEGSLQPRANFKKNRAADIVEWRGLCTA